MLSAQTSQKLIGSDNGLPSPAPVDTPSSASAELPSPVTVECQSGSVVTDALPDPASNKSRPPWYRGPKRYVDKLEKVLATLNSTQFIDFVSGQCGFSKVLQSPGHIVHSYDKNNDPNQDVLDKKCAQQIKQTIEKISCIGVWFGMPCGTFASARRYDGKGPKPLRNRELVIFQDAINCVWMLQMNWSTSCTTCVYYVGRLV